MAPADCSRGRTVLDIVRYLCYNACALTLLNSDIQRIQPGGPCDEERGSEAGSESTRDLGGSAAEECASDGRREGGGRGGGMVL